MRPTRPSVTAAAVLVALVAGPSVAAVRKPVRLPPSKPLVITDQAGDANLVNSQSKSLPADPSQAGPAQHGAADLLSASVGRLDDGRRVLGLKAVFTLSEPPTQGVIYRIQASTPGCGIFWISYNFPAGGSGAGALRSDCATPGQTVGTPMRATVKGTTITVLLPFTALPKHVKLGRPLFVDLVETKGYAVAPTVDPAVPAPAPTVPTFDDADGKSAIYRIGA